MFTKNLRQKKILEVLEKEYFVSTAHLAEMFNVSLETIRRDFDMLAKDGVLHKTYGGAELITILKPDLMPFESRKSTHIAEKQAIAEEAMQFIPDNCTIALDSGSTIFELCKHLSNRKNLTIICSDIHAASELVTRGCEKVFFIGGFLTRDGTSSGMFFSDFFNSISGIDIFVFSTDGAEPSSGITTDELGVNELKKHYLQKAHRKIALIDHSKFSIRGFYKLCNYSDIDTVITDSETPDSIIETISEFGPTVIRL